MPPPTANPDAWGFPSILADAQHIVQEHARRLREQQGGLGRGDVHSNELPDGEGEGGSGGAGERRRSFLHLLQQSRTFLSPECGECMAEALGVTDLYKGLR